MGRVKFTPPIKAKKKGGKIITPEEKKEDKPQGTPLHMTTSISGQSLMFQKPVLKKQKPSDFKTPKKEDPQQVSAPEKPVMTLSVLKFISVSVKGRRLIYEKDNFNQLSDNIEEYIDTGREELKEEVVGKMTEYKNVLASEADKLSKKELPLGVDADFTEAKVILCRAIRTFQECVEDFSFVVEEKDLEVLEETRGNVSKAFSDMDEYFDLRDDIKLRITSQK